ncbi:MAG: hypothetical protein H0V45_03875 [Actinobacteria bacterium]|nr:hypothetical protein [Actinomycetota bacterium]
MDGQDLRIRNHVYGSFWRWTRLDPDRRPRPPAGSQAILDDLGLIGDFWQLR